MIELIFLLPTIICAITITVITWNQRKQQKKKQTMNGSTAY